jgi:hypothetical protein
MMVPMREVPGPVKQIATVSQDFSGCPGSVSEATGGEPRRRVSKGLAGSIRDGGESMAQEFALGIRGRSHWRLL